MWETHYRHSAIPRVLLENTRRAVSYIYLCLHLSNGLTNTLFRTSEPAKILSATTMNSLARFILGSLSVAGASSQVVVTERIGYCGVIPSLVSPISTASSTASPTAFLSATPPSFLAGFQPSLPTPPPLRRRQSLQEYITPDGQLTFDCSASAILTLTPEGELSAGDGGIYSTSQGTESGPFIASRNPGDISTTWQVSDGTLQFNNASFHNGAASICASGSSVEAYYLTEPPATCSPGVLRRIPC